MGCGSSAPEVAASQQDDNKADNAQQAAPPKQAPAVRAGGDVVPTVSVADKVAQAGTKAEKESDKAKSTRARRLSYVTGDKNGVAAPGPELDGADGVAAVEDAIDAKPGAVVPTPSVPQASAVRMSVACVSRAGKEPGFKKTNQDNYVAFEKFVTADQSLFGAMDGHGPHGHLVSGYVKQHLPITLINRLASADGPADVKQALSSTFLEVDAGLSASKIDCEFSGSTVVISHLKGKTLTTAWVGDSRGVVGRDMGGSSLEAVDLTTDHKPTIPEERERILASNGRVDRLVDEYGEPMGPHRVWLQHAWIPGLAMSRALGDVLAHQLGVSSSPQHTVIELDPSYKVMILASDGVWEFISSKEAVDIVCHYESIEEACEQLVEEAYQRWLTEEEGVVDDITAVVVRFLHD